MCGGVLDHPVPSHGTSASFSCLPRKTLSDLCVHSKDPTESQKYIYPEPGTKKCLCPHCKRRKGGRQKKRINPAALWGQDVPLAPILDSVSTPETLIPSETTPPQSLVLGFVEILRKISSCKTTAEGHCRANTHCRCSRELERATPDAQ